MDNFVTSKEQFLQENALTPVVYGSITFDDPAHFDFDLCLVGMNEMKGIKGTQRKWIRELYASWKEVGIEGHVDYISFDRLEKCAQAFQDKVRYTIRGVDLFFDFCSIIDKLANLHASSRMMKNDKR